MKIIIDIPEEIYKASKIINVKNDDTVQIPLEVIAKGTILTKEMSKFLKSNPREYTKIILKELLDELHLLERSDPYGEHREYNNAISIVHAKYYAMGGRYRDEEV